MGQLARAVRESQAVARPLAVLVPLIQSELSAGNNAGVEHYRLAGEMLLEAREQVAAFKWSKWLTKNFDLSRRTAYRYMALAQREVVPHAAQPPSMRTALNEHPSKHWRPVIQATKQVDVETYTDSRQARADEIQLHRDLALELIEIGYKALATRLHPDRGGSKDSMRRLNRVRDELKEVAKVRRFES